MKASAQSIPAIEPMTRLGVGDFMELVKARLTALVLLTTLVGFAMGQQGGWQWLLLAHIMLGTALVASGAAALNQYLERDLDARMRRTEGRPLPSGKMQPEMALVLGGLGSAAGLVYLAIGVNLITALLGAASLVSYLFIYTPLKRVTTLNTVVGAIPGALPPLMGWTAARGEITAGGWALFLILFFWQLPHFLAIAWMYREDYAKAGFVMLPVVDPEGVRTGRQAVSHTLGLAPISLAPFVLGMTGPIYLAGAAILSGGFLFFAVRFSRSLSRESARNLFCASIIYLPLLLTLMLMNKTT